MAEALLNYNLFQDNLLEKIRVISAGLDTQPGWTSPKILVDYMHERFGLDLTNHRAQAVTPALYRQADLVLVMEQKQFMRLAQQYPRQTRKMHLISELDGQTYDIEDPVVRPELLLEKVTSQLQHLLTRGLLNILEWLKLKNS